MKINTMIVLCLISLQLQAQTDRPAQTRTIARVIPTAFFKQK